MLVSLSRINPNRFRFFALSWNLRRFHVFNLTLFGIIEPFEVALNEYLFCRAQVIFKASF